LLEKECKYQQLVRNKSIVYQWVIGHIYF